MADYVTLIGAGDVSRAAHVMQSAAETISSAVGSMTWALEQHQRFMDDWLARLDGTLQDRTHDLGVTLGPLT